MRPPPSPHQPRAKSRPTSRSSSQMSRSAPSSSSGGGGGEGAGGVGEGPGGLGEGSGGVGGLYHERQRLELCGLHALNNLLGRPRFSRRDTDGICKRLDPQSLFNPHRSFLGTGNYDVNVILGALQSLDLVGIWWDKRRSLDQLVLGKTLGFILNIPSPVSLGYWELPFRRKHWLAVRKHQGTYYNLDSKLQEPVAIGGDRELRVFLQEFLSRGICEVFVVVPRAVEEDGSWLGDDG